MILTEISPQSSTGKANMTPSNTQTGATVFYYYSKLPAELRVLTRSYAIEQRRKDLAKQDFFHRKLKLAHLACISREWQAHVEPTTFAAIGPRKSDARPFTTIDLPDFENIVVGPRRAHLRTLEVEFALDEILEEHKRLAHDYVSRPMRCDSSIQEDEAFISAARQLFNVLHKWKLHEVRPQLLSVELFIRAGATGSTYDTLEFGGDFGSLPIVQVIGQIGVKTAWWLETQNLDLGRLHSMHARLPGLTSAIVHLENMEASQALGFIDGPRAAQLTDITLDCDLTFTRRYHENDFGHLLLPLYIKFPQIFEPSIFAMGQTLESLTLGHTVDLLSFFKLFQRGDDGSVARNVTWPSLKTLTAHGLLYIQKDDQLDPTVNLATTEDELLYHVGFAVRHMPSLERLTVETIIHDEDSIDKAIADRIADIEHDHLSIEAEVVRGELGLDYLMLSVQNDRCLKPSQTALAPWVESAASHGGRGLTLRYQLSDIEPFVDADDFEECGGCGSLVWESECNRLAKRGRQIR